MEGAAQSGKSKDRAAAGLAKLPAYVVDTRPLCEGGPFILTDVAHPRLVLKRGGNFLVLNESGHIPACNTLGYGYYHYDTRHISEWEIVLNDSPLVFLSCSQEEGYKARLLYTNTHQGTIPQQKLTVQREVVLSDYLWERITVENFHSEAVSCQLKISFQSDFADMFEVRGLNRTVRGERMVPVQGADGQSLYLAYRGLDGILQETIIEFFGLKPESIDRGQVTFSFELPKHQTMAFEICVSTRLDGRAMVKDTAKDGYLPALKCEDGRYHEWRHGATTICTDSELFNLFWERCYADFYILRQATPKGYGLAAGIPWYAAVFGRDSAIAGLQTLPFFPDLARESLEVLSRYQGKRYDEFKEERPGRIMHELRLGELARTNQIPHNPYYGTVDATQLWLILFCRYLHWTGDEEFAFSLWPNVKAAVNYLEEASAGGYIAYERTSEQGLENQGWKDSSDSIMHIDGTQAKPPIAVCEAQAYLYLAWKDLAKVCERLGYRAMSNKLNVQAEQLKCRFQDDFWLDNEQFIALALDGDGRKSRVLSSNAGHCLMSGIIDGDKAQAVAARLMTNEMQSGWGIRTLSDQTAAYNPISYHNGSIWPHDNAMIAEGLRKIGNVKDVHRIMHGLCQAWQQVPDLRLPELFCGFPRNGALAPIGYPVSCSPQAWATGSAFQLLTACLGLKPDALNQRLEIIEPSLPDWLGEVSLLGLRVGKAVLDLRFSTASGSTYCQILRKEGNVRVVIES